MINFQLLLLIMKPNNKNPINIIHMNSCASTLSTLCISLRNIDLSAKFNFSKFTSNQWLN